MGSKNLKGYNSPELTLYSFVLADIITSSGEENLGGIPEIWLSGTQGGVFDETN